MTKILFMIHDLGPGGAEKVLVNLVNNMDPKQFDIKVVALFGGGVNERFLAPHVHYRAIFPREFPGNSHVLKLFSPKVLHKWFIKEHYDIEVAYLEGVAARVVSGCPHEDTKLVAWIHCTMRSVREMAIGFRSVTEARTCFGKMQRIVFVSTPVREAFLAHCPYNGKTAVLPNVNESDMILSLAAEDVAVNFQETVLHMVAVGKLTPHKGFDRLLRIVNRLCEESYPIHLHILGNGPQQETLERFIVEHHLQDYVTLHGYQTNPYKFIAKCDLFVCVSHAEGFSTAATEALILGTPVCTVEVSGMKEMLGENNEYGVVVDNDDEALYEGVKRLLDDPALLAHYKEQAIKRGKDFSTEKTVQAVETMLFAL